MNRGTIARIEPRSLLLAMFVIVGLTLMAAYLYLFKPDLKELGQLREIHDRSRNALSVQKESLDSESIEELKQQVEQLSEDLFGKYASRPSTQVISYIIGELDEVSRRTDIELLGVKPGAGSSVLNFEEIPFDVEVRGAYPDLYRWLRDAEKELRPMVVKQFHLIPQAGSKRVSMQLRVVSYRPKENIL